MPRSSEECLELLLTKVLKDLIRLRKSRMTQAEVARKMKVSRQQVYNIESGYAGDPSVRTLERYAKAIGAKIQIVSLP